MKNKQKPFLVKLVILSTVTAVIWVAASIYQSIAKKEEPSVPAAIMQPLTPTLDKKVLDELENRVFLEESQIPETRVEGGVAAPTQTPEAVEETVPEETEAPEETPATESGEAV